MDGVVAQCQPWLQRVNTKGVREIERGRRGRKKEREWREREREEGDIKREKERKK